MKESVRSVIRQYAVCRHLSSVPSPLLLGQLLPECITLGAVFENIRVDCTGQQI